MRKSTNPRSYPSTAVLILAGVILAAPVAAAASGGATRAASVTALSSWGGGSSGPLPTFPSVPLSMRMPPTTSGPAQPRWFQIVYAPTVSSNNPMVLNIQGASLHRGEPLILWPRQQGAANELWHYTKDGYFQSGLGDYPGNPWTSKHNPAQPFVFSEYNSAAVDFPSQAGTNEGGKGEFQLWYNNLNSCCASPGNHLFQNYLSASSGKQGTAVTFSQQPQYQWAYWPPRTVQPILDEPDDPYLQFTGAQATAYTHLNDANHPGVSSDCTLEKQSYTGVRCQYDNLAQSLSNYKTAIATYFNNPPSGVTPAAWQDVLKQILRELDNASDVRNLYAQINNFYNTSFLSNSDLVAQLISDAQIETGQNVSGSSVFIFLEIIQTAIRSTLGPLTGGLSAAVAGAANLLEAGINTAVGNGKLSDQPFRVAVSDLYEQINSDFKLVMDAAGTNEIAILDDWGRSQKIEQLISSSGPDSLNWDPDVTPALIQAMQPGFEVAVMQTLLPARYGVFPIPQTTVSDFFSGIPSGIPSYDRLNVYLGNGVWNAFAIATGNDLEDGEYPGKQAIQDDVFGNGVVPLQFFNNLNGWKFPLLWDDFGIPSATGCNQLIVSITNQTADDLTLSFQYEDGGGLLGSGNPMDPPARDLPPYATDVVGLLGNGGHGPDFKFCVSNGSPGDCQAVNYAHFEVQQDLCEFEAGEITYTQRGNRVYQDAQLDINGGSFANYVPGIARIAIYNPNADQ